MLFKLILSRQMVSSSDNSRLPSSPLAMSHSHTFTFPETDMKKKLEQKRKEAVWDLFQSESTFLRDHLMAIKNVILFLSVYPLIHDELYVGYYAANDF